MLGRCSLRHRFPVCSSGGNSNRKSSFWRLVGICVFPCRTGTSRSCLPSEACKPITSRCGVGSSGMPQRWNDVCALGSDRPTTVGEWTDAHPVKGKWVYLYRAVDSSGATIDSLLSAKRDAAAAERFVARLWAERTVRRRGSSILTSTLLIRQPSLSSKPTVFWGRTVLIDRCNISTTSWNRIIGRSSAGSRKPTFSLVLGSLAHDRRLRSDPYDPQRPGVRKRAGCEGRSTPLLHSRFVQRGDGLILRTLSPNFALTPKLQHYHLECPDINTGLKSIPFPSTYWGNQLMAK